MAYDFTSRKRRIPSDELVHHGVPGMRWGVRKAKTVSAADKKQKGRNIIAKYLHQRYSKKADEAKKEADFFQKQADYQIRRYVRQTRENDPPYIRELTRKALRSDLNGYNAYNNKYKKYDRKRNRI